MVSSILDNDNLKNFIISLKLNPEQEKILFDELPELDENERLELLNTLKDVYILNTEKDQAIKKVRENF